MPIGALNDRQMAEKDYRRLRALNKARVTILGVQPEAEPPKDTEPFIDGEVIREPLPPIIYLPGPKTKKRRAPKRPEDYTAPSDEL